MKKIKDGLRLIRLFLRLVFEMIRNYPFLNHDLEHNFRICKKICRRIVKSARIKLQIFYEENIPKDEPFLLVSNHRCFFDVVFLLATIEETISFVAAKELWRYPILRKYLDSIGCVALDRYTKEMDQLKESILSMKYALDAGNLVLFPEGECSYHDYHMRKFKKGGFVGITDPKQKIVPVFLKMDTLCSIGRWMIPQGQVSVVVGTFFTPSDLHGKRITAGEIAAYAQQQVLLLQQRVSS